MVPGSFLTWVRLKAFKWVFIAKDRSELSIFIFYDLVFFCSKYLLTTLKSSELILVNWTSVGSHQFTLRIFIRKRLWFQRCCQECIFHIIHRPLYEGTWEKFLPDLTTENRCNSYEQSVCFYLMNSELYNGLHLLHLVAGKPNCLPMLFPVPIYV